MGSETNLVDKYSSQHKRSRMSTQDQNSQQCFPQLCKNGCGFFSSIDSKGFCSVCYKDYLKKEAASDSASVETSSKEEVPSTVSESMSQLTLEESEKQDEAAAVVIPDVEEAPSDPTTLPPKHEDKVDAANDKEKNQKTQ